MLSKPNVRAKSRLTLLHVIDKRHPRYGRMGLYSCSCGSIKECSISHVNRGQVRSCGCLRVENGKSCARWTRKHGDSFSPEYSSWSGAKDRCNNAKSKDYPNYGGRGIKICERWANYTNFLADIGRKPSPQHSLDRINVNGDYCPDNCKWSTIKEQNENRRVHMVNATDYQVLLHKLQRYEELYGDLP